MKPFKSTKEYNAWARAEKEEVIRQHLEDIYQVNVLLKTSYDLDRSRALHELLNLLHYSLKAVRATKVLRKA